ncbi:MAG: LysR family transcriptional regulator [Pseudomonadales bacterium]
MDIRQLRHLVALVELGTVHAAAEDQSISQPGLSGSIKRLEDQLGTILFEREGRGMKPNTKGQEFYRHAKHILEQLRLARVELDGGQSTLKIGVTEVRPSNFVAMLTYGLTQDYPNLKLEFLQASFETLFSQLEKGEVDAAFVCTLPEHIPDTLMGQTLTSSEYVVCCAFNHPLTRGKGKITIDQLVEYRWLRNSFSPSRGPIVPQFAGHNKPPLENVRFVSVNSQEMAIQLVVNSELLGYGPRMSWETELARGNVVELNLPIAKIDTAIMGVKRRGIYSGVLDKAFDITEAYFADRDN